MSLILRAAAIGLFAATGCGCWEGTTREVSSTVLFLDGEPAIDHGSRNNPILLRIDFHPARGDIVRTPGSSRAGIALLPNLLIQLERGSRMEIVRLAVTKDGNETGSDMRGRFAEIKLTNGRLVASHVWGEALASFRVATPQGDITTPSNTLFLVECDPAGTRVICASGWVEFQPVGAANAVRIPPGSIGRWPSATPNITMAEADPAAQEALQHATDTEQILRKLSTQKRNVLPR